jgi:hypothetical protein
MARGGRAAEIGGGRGFKFKFKCKFKLGEIDRRADCLYALPSWLKFCYLPYHCDL